MHICEYIIAYTINTLELPHKAMGQKGHYPCDSIISHTIIYITVIISVVFVWLQVCYPPSFENL